MLTDVYINLFHSPEETWRFVSLAHISSIDQWHDSFSICHRSVHDFPPFSEEHPNGEFKINIREIRVKLKDSFRRCY